MNDGFNMLAPAIQHHVVNTLGWPELRPLQERAIAPVIAGDDCLLLAPTAGGKTEAAVFPLLSRMAQESWQGLSVLYVCPLKALLNNLAPRLDAYAGWMGRRAQVRHGDTTTGARRRQVREPPDVLLTTPESLESMLISTLVDAPLVFANVRAVVVDEVHAFAGDDRGWHLLAVLERVAALAGRPLQRIGLSATVGNAGELLGWLQGGNYAAGQPATVVATTASPVTRDAASWTGQGQWETGGGVVPRHVEAELELDFVGNVNNAATVIAALHAGQKRLVFADARRTVESLAVGLRERGVETYVSHSSLSADERHRAEEAFTVARDCVITSTSTLELGIDVGDLDRVIQVGAPATVASMLQRLGRTGRRPGSARNMLFLATKDEEFLQAAGLLLLHDERYVEPVRPPGRPRHVLAQQLLGLVLQERQVGEHTWAAQFADLALGEPGDAEEVAAWQLASGHLDRDEGMLFAGPEAERRYGRVHYRDLMAVFTADPEIIVFHGRTEIGSVDPMALATKVEGPRVIALAGRSWTVRYTDWRRRRAYVEPSDRAGRSKWFGMPQPQSFALADAIRRVLCGTDTGAPMTHRAQDALARLRGELGGVVDEAGIVLAGDARDGGRVRLWTWAGSRANAVLVAAIDAIEPDLLGETATFDNWRITLRSDATVGWIRSVFDAARVRFGDGLDGVVPQVDDRAVRQLKFSEMLPPEHARATLAARFGDWPAAARTVRAPVIGGL